MKKININYSKISNGWEIEYFLKKQGFKKTAEALWVQCYYNAEKDVEVNTFFEERKPETPETEWKAEIFEAIAEQPTEEPTAEQAEQQTEEHAEPETMPETAETEKECRTMNKNIKIEYRWYKNNYDWYENPNTPETEYVIIEPDGDFENLLEINGVWCEYDEEMDVYHVIEQDENGEYIRTGERYHIIRRTETDEELYY